MSVTLAYDRLSAERMLDLASRADGAAPEDGWQPAPARSVLLGVAFAAVATVAVVVLVDGVLLLLGSAA